ncbi:MAG TPA: chromosome segregation protein SMC, partial [Roseiflexaceae bacterium]|nr:chromosome segregation protein SMC [Roseiflexaceae bacterium]
AQSVLAGLRARANEAEAAVRGEQALLQANARNGSRLVEQQAGLAQRVRELEQERAALDERNQQLEATHAALLAEIDTLRMQIEPAEAEGAAGEQSITLLEQRTSELTRELLDAESAHGRAAIDVQRAADRFDALWERAAADDIDLDALPDGDVQGETLHAAGDTEGAEPQDIGTRVQQLRARIQRLGAVNPLALEEYEQSSERYEFLTTQLSDLRGAQDAMSELIAELEGAMQARFDATFTAVAAEFEKTFVRLFGGGEARLVLVRPGGAPESNGDQNGHEPASSALMGVDIVARPPGKRQQNLALLSGGERALTAGALLFAILKVNPSPFCVMDEVDAALDEANVGRFREALVELSRETQFLVVTHNRGTIEAADTIYGVSMGDDSASRVLSLRLDELVEE